MATTNLSKGMNRHSVSDNQSQTDAMVQLAKLWSAASPALEAFVRTMVRDANDVDDVIQQTGEYVAREFNNFEQGTSFTGWVITVARIRVRRLWQDRKRDRLVLTPEALDSVAKAAEAMSAEIPSRQAAMQICFKKLQPCHQQLLDMCYWSGQKPSQIAEQLGRSANAVSASLLRIRNALRRCIDEWISLNSESQS